MASIEEAAQHGTLESQRRGTKIPKLALPLLGGVQNSSLESQQMLSSLHEPYNPLAHIKQICYDWILSISLGCQLLLCFILLIADPDMFHHLDKVDIFVLSMCCMIEAIQIGVMVLASFQMVQLLRVGACHPNSLWKMYVGNTLLFAGVGVCFYAASGAEAYKVIGYDASDTIDHRDVYEILGAFYYYSVATMTSTGYGDIYPVTWYAQALSIIEMAVAVVYSFGLFSVGLTFWQKKRMLRDRRLENTSYLKRCCRVFRQIPIVEKMRRWIVTHILFISVLFQTITVFILMIFDHDIYNHDVDTQVVHFCIVFQILQAFLIIGVSIRTVRKINNKQITTGFLVQSYLATVLMFGGIYFMLFLLKGFNYFLFPEEEKSSKSIAQALFTFIYFSFACQTVTGYGEIAPLSVVPRIAVTIQMLVSVLFAFVVLGLGLSYLTSRHNLEEDSAPAINLDSLLQDQDPSESYADLQEGDHSGPELKAVTEG